MSGIIDGKALSQEVKDGLKIKVADFKKKYGRDITLAVVLVGDDPASQIYVKNKIKAAEYVGIRSLSFTLPIGAAESEVVSLVNTLANDNSVNGILVQLPLPKGIDERKILSLIPPYKDVDGFTAENIGNLTLFNDSIVSCTPLGIIYMLKSIGVPLSGKRAVVLGRSNIVGKPVSLLLLRENCTVTVCHSKTENLKDILLSADILVVAIGKAKFVTADMVKEGAIVIDVGINRTKDGLSGDVDFDEVSKKTSYITPVPGGVGPMTIAMLMSNAYKCATVQADLNDKNG